MLLNVVTGLVVGIASASLIYVLHFLGVLRTPLGGQLLLLAIVFHTTGLLFALLRQRARDTDIPFARLFGAGLMLSLIAGLALAVGSYLFLTVVDPTYIDWVKERSREQLEAFPDLPVEERAAGEEQIAALTPGAYATQGLVGTLMIGFLLSLTLSAFLRMRVLRRQPS